jgi:hypothetical protein
MILPFHVAIALISIVYTAFLYFSPTQAKFRVSYALVGLTVGSGTWLILSNPAHMVQACISGLVYLSIIFLGIALARSKLASTNK